MAILITSFAALLLLLLLEPDVQLPSPFIQATNVPYPDTSPSPLKALNITTIATTPQNESAIECWQLAAPLQESTTPGTAGAVAAQLGNTTRLSYSIIPTRFDGGLHNAPAVQYVSFCPMCSFSYHSLSHNAFHVSFSPKLINALSFTPHSPFPFPLVILPSPKAAAPSHLHTLSLYLSLCKNKPF